MAPFHLHWCDDCEKLFPCYEDCTKKKILDEVECKYCHSNNFVEAVELI